MENKCEDCKEFVTNWTILNEGKGPFAVCSECLRARNEESHEDFVDRQYRQAKGKLK